MALWPGKSDSCLWCGGALEGRARQARYCSTRCRWDANHNRQTDLARNNIRLSGGYAIGDQRPCVICNRSFVKSSARHVTCSVECASDLSGVELWRRDLPPHCPVTIAACDDCGNLTACKTRRGGLCNTCSIDRQRERYRRKNQKRRGASGRGLTVRQLRDRDGDCCYLCGNLIDCSLSGLDSDGPTIDHVMPLARGGDNSSDNLRLTHRKCNTVKGASVLTLIPA